MNAASTIATTPLGRATLGDQLRRHARTLRDKPAFVSYGIDGARRVTTYRELDEQANRFASALLAHGVRRGALAVVGLDQAFGAQQGSVALAH